MAFAVSNKMSLRSAASKQRSVAAKANTTKGTTSGRGGAGAISNIDYLKSLPGVSQPFPDVFDPANLSATASVKDLRRWRESELVHGRISMLAALGFVVQENIEDNTAFFPFAGKITGPAIYHFQQIKQGFWEPLLILIGIAEAYRVAYGWAPPVNGENFNALREGYDMGDLGFDPLGLKPKDPEALKDLQTKELNNGRLAMIAVAGFVGQELLFQHEVLNWGGFQQSLAEAPVDPSSIKPPPLPVEFPDRGVPNIKDVRLPNANDVKGAFNYSSGKGLTLGSLPSGGEIANKAQELKNNLPGLPSFGGFKAGVENAANNLPSGQDVANKAGDIKDSLPSFSGFRTSLAQNLPSGGEIANKAQEVKNSLPGGLPSGGEIANKAQEVKNNLPGLPSFGGFKAGVENAANNLPSGQDVANKAGDIKDSLPSFSGFRTSLAQNLPSGGEIVNKVQEVKNSLPGGLPSGGEIANKAQELKNNLPSLPNLGGFKTGLIDGAQDLKNSLPSTQDVKNALPSPQDIFNRIPDVPTPQVSLQDVRTPGRSF